MIWVLGAIAYVLLVWAALAWLLGRAEARDQRAAMAERLERIRRGEL